MKKVCVFMGVAGAMLAMSSCRSVEKAAPLSSIGGEWNIVEVNGAKVLPGESRMLPVIAFDTETGRLSGNSGCNRMMGSFDVNAAPGILKLSGIGGTKMLCPDMSTERNVLGALAQVTGYRKAGAEKMYLCNDARRPVMALEKKEVKLSALNGEWKIKEVDGEAIPSGMDTQPFLAFDVKKREVHGNAGCNLVNGTFETEADNVKSISFPGLATTMMACPNTEVEGKVLKALNDVKSFDVLGDGSIGLCDAGGEVRVVLKK